MAGAGRWRRVACLALLGRRGDERGALGRSGMQGVGLLCSTLLSAPIGEHLLVVHLLHSRTGRAIFRTGGLAMPPSGRAVIERR